MTTPLVDHTKEGQRDAIYPKTTDTERLFAYGSLMNADTRTRALGHRANTMPAVLPGYERKVRNEGDERHPDGFKYLVEHPSGTVRGQLLRLTRADLRKLDRWEAQYHRQAVYLADGKMAWAYFINKRDL